jgi:hypothetical protein
VKEATCRREGYDRGEITGEFAVDPAFPGCPHCRSKSFCRCGCGKVGCWNGEVVTFTCPWCGASGRLGGTVDRLEADADR